MLLSTGTTGALLSTTTFTILSSIHGIAVPGDQTGDGMPVGDGMPESVGTPVGDGTAAGVGMPVGDGTVAGDGTMALIMAIGPVTKMECLPDLITTEETACTLDLVDALEEQDLTTITVVVW